MGEEFLTACGHLPLAILCFVCLGVLMVVFLLVLLSRRLKTGMPVAGSCSAAISAACHLLGEMVGAGASRRALQWGEVMQLDGEMAGGGKGNEGLVAGELRRCAFSHGGCCYACPRRYVLLCLDIYVYLCILPIEPLGAAKG